MAVGPADLRKLLSERYREGIPATEPLGTEGTPSVAAELPPAREFLAQDRGLVRSVQTESDESSRGRKIVKITFVNETKYEFYIYSADSAEQAYETIIDYLTRYGYPDYVFAFEVEFSDYIKTLDDLKRDVGEFEPERIMTTKAERTVAADNDMTVNQLRRAVREFKARVATAGRETTTRATAKPRGKEKLRGKAKLEISAARLKATYETLVRESDLANPSLPNDERMSRAIHLRKTYYRLRDLDPSFKDDGEQLRLAHKLLNARAHQRRQAAKLAAD